MVYQSGMWRRWAVIVVLALWASAAVPPADGQDCGGDCNGDGAVSIGDLIVAVRVLLGEAPIAECRAADVNGNGVVAINELIIAVRNGLRGCPLTPTPTPTFPPTATATATLSFTVTPTPTSTAPPSPSATLTASATATPSSTPTPTPTWTPTIEFPDVSGLWNEGQLQLVSSTCFELFATEFAAELARRPPCPHQVSAVGARATIVDCNQRAFIGTLSEQGRIDYELPTDVGEEDGCTVTLAAAVRIEAVASPAAATYFFDVDFSGTCPLDSCTLTAVAPWQRESGG